MTTEANYDALLTLAIPAALEEELLDFLLQHPQWAGGFSIVDAAGMGYGAPLLSAMEKEQGRARRRLVLIAGADAELRLLLTTLGREIRNPDIAYWISPLSAFGRLQ